MQNKFTIDMDKLNDISDDPVFEKEFYEVFSFVEAITGQKYNPDNMTSENIEMWNQKFGAVLEHIFAHAK